MDRLEILLLSNLSIWGLIAIGLYWRMYGSVGWEFFVLFCICITAQDRIWVFKASEKNNSNIAKQHDDKRRDISLDEISTRHIISKIDRERSPDRSLNHSLESRQNSENIFRSGNNRVPTVFRSPTLQSALEAELENSFTETENTENNCESTLDKKKR